MTTVTATEMKNKFGKYLEYVQEGNEVIILKNGNEVARLVSVNRAHEFLTDSLVGVIKDVDYNKSRAEHMTKYESID